jgi:peptidyl-prolyl cis-trans isomerase SurA
LYSKDPGSATNGGFYKMNRKRLLKEFKDVAFSKKERFQPFETDFGFHIIYVEKLKVKRKLNAYYLFLQSLKRK